MIAVALALEPEEALACGMLGRGVQWCVPGKASAAGTLPVLQPARADDI